MKKTIALVLFSFLILTACNKKEEPVVTNQTASVQAGSGQLSGEITEVLQTPSYTYLKLKKDNSEKWIAVTKREAEAGQTIYYEAGMEMKNFESKTLNRTFPSVWFVSKAGFEKNETATATAHSMMNPHKKNMRKSSAQASVNITKNSNEISIADLYKNPKKFEGKIIQIKGQVTKFNANILDKNWIHIQDGTEFNKKYDLTITTAETVNIRDVVTFKGKIILNKDFGAGYRYDIIMEEAVKN